MASIYEFSVMSQQAYQSNGGTAATGCNLYGLENDCAALRVREQILDHPQYLQRMREILERPCKHAISPHEPPSRREEILRGEQNLGWMKTYLQRGEPAWNLFGCERQAENDSSGPRKVVLNVFRPLLDNQEQNWEVSPRTIRLFCR